MLPLYVFAAILGGGLLLIGFLGGDGDVGEAAHFDSVSDTPPGDTAWTRLFSLRTLSYALAAFGLTGAALAAIGTGTFLTLVLALAMGAVGGAMASFIFRWVMANQGGFGESSDRYIGHIGQTEVRIPDGGRGRINLVHQGYAFTLAATSLDGEIGRNETVVVVDIVDGIAVVGRAPKELAP